MFVLSNYKEGLSNLKISFIKLVNFAYYFQGSKWQHQGKYDVSAGDL